MRQKVTSEYLKDNIQSNEHIASENMLSTKLFWDSGIRILGKLFPKMLPKFSNLNKITLYLAIRGC